MASQLKKMEFTQALANRIKDQLRSKLKAIGVEADLHIEINSFGILIFSSKLYSHFDLYGAPLDEVGTQIKALFRELAKEYGVVQLGTIPHNFI